ncbi:neuronal acetylcholine receptor subunit alpha-7-like [Littorina saxatilis]|uniref:Uncharacterized protein n=1 Tax=Littorina saxatilis TaxID=31220 RepID=A0AAN9BZQ3_9CAEN
MQMNGRIKLHAFGLVFIMILTLSENGFVSASAKKNESNLIRKVLLKYYDTAVRPVLEPTEPLPVNVSIGIKAFIEVDTKKQTMTSFGWLKVEWFDAFLTWNKSEYGIGNVFLPSKDIWHPELVIFNTVKKMDELEGQMIKVKVRHDGKVKWFAGGLFQTFCSIDISRYPVDTQSCSIEVVSWSLNTLFIDLRISQDPFDITLMENHPEWMLVGTGSENVIRGNNFVALRFTFTLKRKVLFYVINIILPIVLLSLMNCLVFLLPVESGEKMTVSVTVFLSFAVFMTLINESLPKNSDTLCLFNAYVAVQMFLSVCSIVMATVIVFIFDKDNDEEGDRSQKKSGCHRGGVSEGVMHPSGLSAEPTSVRELGPQIGSEGSSPAAQDSSLNHTTSTSNGRISSASSSTDSSLALCRASPSVESSSEQPHAGCLVSVCAFWKLLRKAKDGSAKDRREFSKALDKIFFVLTIFLNVFSGIVFIAIMIGS